MEMIPDFVHYIIIQGFSGFKVLVLISAQDQGADFSFYILFSFSAQLLVKWRMVEWLSCKGKQ